MIRITARDDLVSIVDGRLYMVQEKVPGKQVSVAHIISKPEKILMYSIGMDTKAYAPEDSAIAILNINPWETTIVACDIALKTAKADVTFIDRFNGALVFTGRLAPIEQAMKAIMTYLKKLDYELCEITKT